MTKDEGDDKAFGDEAPLTIREWFAGLAMNGLVAGGCYGEGVSWREVARLAFKAADAIVEESAKGPPEPPPVGLYEGPGQ